MKKAFALIMVVLIFGIVLSSCVIPADEVLDPLGKYKGHEFYTHGEFQDYTAYAKYYYDSVDFTDNKYFTKIKQSDINVLNEHLDDFENMIETFRNNDASREIVVNYDFDRSLIDCEDYLYIDAEKHTDNGYTVFVYYHIYFFDTQTNTLYYFHNI